VRERFGAGSGWLYVYVCAVLPSRRSILLHLLELVRKYLEFVLELVREQLELELVLE
jgi:hypothetical protein